MDHIGRIASLQGRLAELEVDALLVTDLTNVRYLTNFSGTAGSVLISPDVALFMSDGRYAARAAALVEAAEVAIYPQRLTDVLEPRLRSSGVKVLGIEGATVTLAERDDLAERLPDVELKTTSKAVEDMRRTKDPEEIAALRAAVGVGDEAFSWVLEQLRPGVTEAAIGLELEVRMRRSGADEISFDPIVGSGPNAAHIHHTPSSRPFEKGDLVLLDFGARVDGYCSDLTRTVVLGPATEEQIQAYELVRAAHEAGVGALAAGVHGTEADAAARSVIEAGGRGDEFAHGLGHGVGLDIHEAPRLHRVSEDTLRAGDVVTVEPGVYTPGWGGVRIEDCVLVTEGSGAIVGSAPRDELIEL